jgi:hypothetical protein
VAGSSPAIEAAWPSFFFKPLIISKIKKRREEHRRPVGCLRKLIRCETFLSTITRDQRRGSPAAEAVVGRQHVGGHASLPPVARSLVGHLAALILTVPVLAQPVSLGLPSVSVPLTVSSLNVIAGR